MKPLISGLQQKDMTKYGAFPTFRAGMHGGKVIVTWIGEF
jgi:hypothetical protein